MFEYDMIGADFYSVEWIWYSIAFTQWVHIAAKIWIPPAYMLRWCLSRLHSSVLSGHNMWSVAAFSRPRWITSESSLRMQITLLPSSTACSRYAIMVTSASSWANPLSYRPSTDIVPPMLKKSDKTSSGLTPSRYRFIFRMPWNAFMKKIRQTRQHRSNTNKKVKADASWIDKIDERFLWNLPRIRFPSSRSQKWNSQQYCQRSSRS